MASNPPRVTDLINRLLDKGYHQAADSALQAVAHSTTSGIVAQRLRELDEEAARLAAEGKKLDRDNPILRAVLADLETTLKADEIIVSSASENVQQTGIDAAGTVQRQLSLPGFTNEQLARIGIRWNVPDPEAIARIIGYTRSDAWRSELGTMTDDVMQSVINQAISGIINGWGPLRTAAAIRKIAEGMPPYIANNLMRTLQLTGYRDSTAVYMNANSDIAKRVIRIAALDTRTCLSCVALHGTVIWDSEKDAGTPIPRVDDHHSGRCTAYMEVVGFNYGPVQTGPEWFAKLSPERQAQQNSFLKSPGKYEAYRSGQVTLGDFIHPYQDDVFGRMVREGSLRDALARP